MRQPAQQITAEHQEVIGTWPEDWRPIVSELAVHAPLAFESFSQKYGYSPNLVRPYKRLALCDEAMAIRILEMPFLGTRNEGFDSDVLKDLARLAESDLRGLDKVLSHPVIEGGITENSRALAVLLVLEQQQPEVAAAVQALPWVQEVMQDATLSLDEIQAKQPGFIVPYSHLAANTLATMARESSETLMGLLALPWIQDQFSSSEYGILVTISIIASKDDGGTARVVRMPFLQSLEPEDEEVLDILYGARGGFLHRLISDPILNGDITDGMKHLVAFAALRLQNPGVAAHIEALPWVQDGLDQSEDEAISSLWDLASISVPASQEIVAKQWVQDGLNETEWSAINALAWMLAISQNQVNTGYTSHQELVLAIPGMPFMETIEPIESAALASLRILLQSEDRHGYVQQVLSHPLLRGGVTDDLTPVISVLSKASPRRPELLNVLLDPEQTLVEERSLYLPLAGEVSLWVVWPEMMAPTSAATRTMDLLEHSANTIEEFMGVPYPEGYTVVLVANVQHRGAASGGSVMTLSLPVAINPGVIAHETAHVYWTYWDNPSSSITWIVEGAANFLDRISERARTGAQLPEPQNTCSLAENIAALVRLPAGMGEEIYASSCNYILGEGMFLELYGSLGDMAFRQSFARLFQMIRDGVFLNESMPPDRGYSYINEAFVVEASNPADAAIAEEIINRRYYGE